jgi:hypothetical protein
LRLEIDITAGVSGRAFLKRRGFIADLSVVSGGPTWGLGIEEEGRVRRSVRSVLSVPIFDPRNPTAGLLGTLTVDSDVKLELLGWLQEGWAIDFAQTTADLIAMLLMRDSRG